MIAVASNTVLEGLQLVLRGWERSYWGIRMPRAWGNVVVKVRMGERRHCYLDGVRVRITMQKSK